MPDDYEEFLFYHAGTDEVYGSALENEYFNEESKYKPDHLFCSKLLIVLYRVGFIRIIYQLLLVIVQIILRPFQFTKINSISNI